MNYSIIVTVWTIPDDFVFWTIPHFLLTILEFPCFRPFQICYIVANSRSLCSWISIFGTKPEFLCFWAIPEFSHSWLSKNIDRSQTYSKYIIEMSHICPNYGPDMSHICPRYVPDMSQMASRGCQICQQNLRKVSDGTFFSSHSPLRVKSPICFMNLREYWKSNLRKSSHLSAQVMALKSIWTKNVI